MLQSAVLQLISILSIIGPMSTEEAKKDIVVDGVGHLCDLSKCSKLTMLIDPDPITVNLSSSTIKAKITTFPPTIDMLMVVKEFRWKNCAPTWTSYSDLEGGGRLRVSRREMQQIVDSHMCSIGKICWADNCMNEDNEQCGISTGYKMDENHGYTVDMSCNFRYAVQWTCLQDFSCKTHHVSNPIFVGVKDGKFIPYVKSPLSNELHDIRKEFFADKDGISYFLPAVKEDSKKEEEVNVRCYKDKVSSICRIEDGEHVGTTFEKSGNTILKNNIAIVLSDVSDKEPTFKDYKAASINDAKALFEVVQYVSMQTENNIVKLAHEIRQISVALVKIIKSLGKVDDSLIGNIMEKPSKTIWATPDVFKQCACASKTRWDWNELEQGQSPCSDPTIPFQKVVGGYIMSDYDQESVNKWIERHRLDACSANNKTVVKKKLDFEEFDIEYDHIYMPTMTGTAADWSGMTWIIGMLNQEMNAILKRKDLQIGSGLFSGLKGFGFMEMIMANISWIALFIALLAFFRAH